MQNRPGVGKFGDSRRRVWDGDLRVLRQRYKGLPGFKTEIRVEQSLERQGTESAVAGVIPLVTPIRPIAG